MDKPVSAFQTHNQLQTDRLPQIRVDLLLRGPVNNRKYRYLGDVPEAGKVLQRSLGFTRQAGQFPEHQLHHVVGVTLGVNATEIPGPSRSVMIEGEQALFGERRHELKREKRIATRLVM